MSWLKNLVVDPEEKEVIGDLLCTFCVNIDVSSENCKVDSSVLERDPKSESHDYLDSVLHYFLYYINKFYISTVTVRYKVSTWRIC